VIAALQAAGVESRTLVQSFDWRTLQHLLASGVDIATACLTDVRAKGGTIRRGESGPSPWTAGFDVDDFDGSVPRLVHAAGCRVWSPDYQDLSLPDVQRAHGLGLRVIPWTVNRSRNITALLDLGVDGMISDHPERVRAVLAERGLPLPQAFEEP